MNEYLYIIYYNDLYMFICVYLRVVISVPVNDSPYPEFFFRPKFKGQEESPFGQARLLHKSSIPLELMARLLVWMPRFNTV